MPDEPKKATQVVRDWGLELVTDLYELWKAHKFAGTIFAAFTLFAYGVALHHIGEFLPIAKAIALLFGVPVP